MTNLTPLEWGLVVLAAALGVADALLEATGNPTISASVRSLNQKSSGLAQWGLAGLWLHFFIGAWGLK
jgi:hypothetical protein